MNKMHALFPNVLVSPSTDLEYLRKNTKMTVDSSGSGLKWVFPSMKHE